MNYQIINVIFMAIFLVPIFIVGVSEIKEMTKKRGHIDMLVICGVFSLPMAILLAIKIIELI